MSSGETSAKPSHLTEEEWQQEEHARRHPCSGCAHSASNYPFPGKPSGEHACCSCMRNISVRQHGPVRFHEQTCFHSGARVGVPASSMCSCTSVQYRSLDGFSPIAKVTDNYITLDRLDQLHRETDRGAALAAQAVFDVIQQLKKTYGNQVMQNVLAAEAAERLGGK